MYSISAEHLSKCYRLGKQVGQSMLPQPLRRVFARGGAIGAGSRQPREVWALNDVSFAVKSGTILGVIGPNGAGKTTLLKVLGRVTLPTQGRVVGRGRVVSLLALGAGFQPDLTGRENIYLQAALYGIPGSEVSRRFDEIAHFADLGDFLNVPVRRYSSGMYLRLAFSAAIHMNGDILLADEVLAVGDLVFQERCLERVEQAGAEGMTVLFVSHDMAAIRRLCNRVIWLNAGQIIEDGDPDTVVSRYEETARTTAMGGPRTSGSADEHGEILAVRLLGATGEEIGAARASEPVLLQVMLTVKTAGVLVRCALSVSARGVLAFRSMQSEPFRVSEPGTFDVRMRIPPHLLSDTVYTVKAGAVLAANDHESLLVQDAALSFQVYDEEAGLPLWGSYQQRAGVVSPRLEWQVVQEEHVVVV